MAKSGFIGIFNKDNIESDWPRVVLTVESVNKGSFDSIGSVDIHGDDHRTFINECITVSAIVWSSNKSFKKIEPVEVCEDQINRLPGVALRTYGENNDLLSIWATSFNDPMGSSKRAGPAYPQYRITQADIFLKRFRPRKQSSFTVNLDGLFQLMGIDLEKIEILSFRNIWINKMPTEESSNSHNRIKLF